MSVGLLRLVRRLRSRPTVLAPRYSCGSHFVWLDTISPSPVTAENGRFLCATTCLSGSARHAGVGGLPLLSGRLLRRMHTGVATTRVSRRWLGALRDAQRVSRPERRAGLDRRAVWAFRTSRWSSTALPSMLKSRCAPKAFVQVSPFHEQCSVRFKDFSDTGAYRR